MILFFLMELPFLPSSEISDFREKTPVFAGLRTQAPYSGPLQRSEQMIKKMGYRATLDWLLDNDDLSGFMRQDKDPAPTTACNLAAKIFGKTMRQLWVDLNARSINRHAIKQRYGE